MFLLRQCFEILPQITAVFTKENNTCFSGVTVKEKGDTCQCPMLNEPSAVLVCEL